MFAFMDPLDIDVWLYTATAFLGVTVLFYLIARYSPPTDNDYEHLGSGTKLVEIRVRSVFGYISANELLVISEILHQSGQRAQHIIMDISEAHAHSPRPTRLITTDSITRVLAGIYLSFCYLCKTMKTPTLKISHLLILCAYMPDSPRTTEIGSAHLPNRPGAGNVAFCKWQVPN